MLGSRMSTRNRYKPGTGDAWLFLCLIFSGSPAGKTKSISMSNEKQKSAYKGIAFKKDSSSNEPDTKGTIQSRTFSSMSDEEKKKYIKHDLRAALYVLELVLGSDDILNQVIKNVALDEAKARSIARQKAEVNKQ